MRHESGHFDGSAGNADIYWQSWLPDDAPRAVVGLAHGVSEHSGRYAWVAEQLVARGYALFALDHRGHGRSSGSRALIDRVDNVVADLRTLLDMAARADVHGRRPFLLGHSMGGWLSLAFATRHQDEIEGLILSAPAAVLDAASPVERMAAHLLSVVAPKLGVFEVDSSAVSRDAGVVRDYDADPLNYHRKLPARTIHEMAGEAARFPETIPRLTLPLLVQVGTGDRIVPPRASEFVYESASSQDKTIKHYEGLFHEILNEPEREQVVGDTLDWLDAHTHANRNV